MIDTARKHAAGNLDFALQDINAIDFKDDFDLVFSNATLHWVKDHRRMLRNVYRALRKGGAVRFSFAAAGNCSHFFQVVRNATALPAYRSHFRSFNWPWFMPTAEEYQDLMHRSEFSEVRVWLENADHWFPDAEAMIRWVDQPSLVPFLTCLDEAGRRPFRDFVVEQMVRETAQDDGRCFETFRRINVFARKYG
jgi:trans-aconitate methyltransferase